MAVQNIDLEGSRVTTIEKVKKGDFFILEKGKSVLVKGDFMRDGGVNKYEAYYWNDVGKFVYKKKGTRVIVDFNF